MAQIANSILGRQKFSTQKPVRIAGFKGNYTGKKIWRLINSAFHATLGKQNKDLRTQLANQKIKFKEVSL
jgi:hypothetical protein